MALLLNQKVRGIGLLRTAFYIPSIVPLVATAVLWIWILNPDYGLLNDALRALHLPTGLWLADPGSALPSLVLMGLWGVGGGMIVFLAGLQGVSEEYYEAAKIDGASALAQFRHVTLPLLSPTLFYQIVLGLIASLQYFTQAFILGGVRERHGRTAQQHPVSHHLYLSGGLQLYPDGLRLRDVGGAVRDDPAAHADPVRHAALLGLLRRSRDEHIGCTGQRRAGPRSHAGNARVRGIRAAICGGYCLYIVLYGGAVIFLVPLAWMLLTALKTLPENLHLSAHPAAPRSRSGRTSRWPGPPTTSRSTPTTRCSSP